MTAQQLIKNYPNYCQAAKAFEQETGYKIAVSTIRRVAKGECKPAMEAFICYALRNIEVRK